MENKIDTVYVKGPKERGFRRTTKCLYDGRVVGPGTIFCLWSCPEINQSTLLIGEDLVDWERAFRCDYLFHQLWGQAGTWSQSDSRHSHLLPNIRRDFIDAPFRGNNREDLVRECRESGGKTWSVLGVGCIWTPGMEQTPNFTKEGKSIFCWSHNECKLVPDIEMGYFCIETPQEVRKQIQNIIKI